MVRTAGAVTAVSSSLGYVNWEERYVSSDRGRRKIHYFLNRQDGASDLAVIGTEKSLRHISYHLVFRYSSLLSLPLTKLRSRREVVDWLNSVVSGSDSHHNICSGLRISLLDGVGDAIESDYKTIKGNQLWLLGQNTGDFSWMGSWWSCHKKRKHYQSFRRNGVTISVNDFVYVLAEEDKRLVAYLEDMYEDSKGNKMVVVRWFHKIDEVGFVLPHNYNDREIFFSLCLQDLSIECIDGLASVLCPQHYEKFFNEAVHTHLVPFVCSRQFDSDDITPFNITLVKGYWKQQILKYISVHQPNRLVKGQTPGTDFVDDAARPKKRLRHSKNYVQACNMQDVNHPVLDSFIDGCSAPTSYDGQVLMQTQPNHLDVGSHVEVLSQDSGIRGCWFKAVVIKRHKDMVKVQYEDIKDAEDEYNNLEEWTLATKATGFDDLGLRIGGRTRVRPSPLSSECELPRAVTVGTCVDAWWHDGWWEGIVLQKKTEDHILVYFPGEKRISIFSHVDLRHSLEWLGYKWMPIKESPELVMSIFSDLKKKQRMAKTVTTNIKFDGAESYDVGQLLYNICEENMSEKDVMRSNYSSLELAADEKINEMDRDLLKDDLLVQLRWKASRRRCVRITACKHKGVSMKNKLTASGRQSFDCFRISSSKRELDNCKFVGDRFGSPVVSSLTSLVMSR